MLGWGGTVFEVVVCVFVRFGRVKVLFLFRRRSERSKMRTLQDRGVALVVVATVMALSSVAAEHISSVPTHNMSNKERNELK